jgi:hypothetical protein
MLIDFVCELDAVKFADEIPDGFLNVVGLLLAMFRTCAEKVFESIATLEVEAVGVDYLDGLNRLVTVMCWDLLGHAGIVRGKNE